MRQVTLVYEAGSSAHNRRVATPIGDPSLVSGASVAPCTNLRFLFARGLIDVGFLGGAQIDRYGNVNATVIGDYAHPKVRLPGSGGGAEIAAWADRTYLITPHQKRRFPEKCDFVTGAGFLAGGGARAATGVIGRGPQTVVTDIGLLEPDSNGELILAALHPGRTIEAKANTGWLLSLRSIAADGAPSERAK